MSGASGWLVNPFPVDASMHKGWPLLMPIASQIASLHSVRSALIGSTLAARPAGTALAAIATTVKPTTASR